MSATIKGEGALAVPQVRVHVSALFNLAAAAGFDRYFKTPRGKVGGFEAAEMERQGLPRECALLPMRGNRWPDCAIRRCVEIEHDTSRRLARVQGGAK